ncbi:MAG: SAM-dependent methyltransferase, partial [Paracoccaceae bacterium]|nr:SAM-dependent methyltransferase [Paracoccaceae bacterium]
MIDLWLIGIGTGNPDHVTYEAAQAIRDADHILIPRKGPGKVDLADIRRQIVSKFVQDGASKITEFDLPVRDASGFYLEGVKDWHDAIALVWSETIRSKGAEGQKVALLVWGDPSLYDSTLR